MWEYLRAITYDKNGALANDTEFNSIYIPYIINRLLSQHEDCVKSANRMNERHWLEPVDQFRFLLNTLRPRFRKHEKSDKTDSDDVQAVAEYYDCSIRRARDLVTLHSSEQLAVIRSRLDKGGATKRGTKHDSSP